jgi:hypothetical protein
MKPGIEANPYIEINCQEKFIKLTSKRLIFGSLPLKEEDIFRSTLLSIC